MNIYLIPIIILISVLIFENISKKNIIQEQYTNPNIIISKALKTLGKEKKNIGEIVNKTIYRPGSITVQLKKMISCLLHTIIIELNNILKQHYIIHEFDVIIIEIDREKNKKILVDFFIINTNTSVKKKLITEIILIDNTPHVNYIKLSNAKYNKTTYKILPNDVHNVGTNLVLKNENMLDLHLTEHKKNFIGENLSTLESSEIDYLPISNSYQNISTFRNKWIKPIQTSLNLDNNIFPSRKIYNRWNAKGLQSTDKKKCNNGGINSSETNRNLVAQFNPTIHTLPRDNLGLAGYFDLSVGIPSFPTSTIHPNTSTLYNRD